MTGTKQYVRAEWIRARGSTLWWLAFAGLLLGCVFTVFGMGFQVETASDLMNWHGLLITGMAAPLAALFAGSAETRERTARSGGTAWRPVSARATRAVRLLMVWVALAVFYLLAFGVTWLAAVLLGYEGSSQVALAGLFAWGGALGAAGLAAGASRRIGVLPTIGIAAACNLGLGFFVDRDWWWFNPAAWPLRLVLPAMGKQFNLLPLEPGSPMYGESPLPALGLCLLLAAAGFACAVLMEPRTVRPRRKPETHQVNAPKATRPAVARPTHVRFGAALRGIHRAALTPALVAALALTVLVMVFAIRYPAEVRHALATYVLLPVGAGVLPTLIWPRLRPAWALMQIEHPKTLTALRTWVLAVVAFVVAIAAITGGATLGGEARRFLLAVLTTGALALLALIITARFGVAWALAATIVWTVFSLTIGGDVLASTPLWILAVPAWPEVADTTVRFAIALTAAVALFVAAWAGAGRALKGIAPLRR
ncbi:ABC-2 family transporter protein [Corynebacterium glaucum]|uniref:hypothetical protein n=1 Tax=Corynebacterium glaucum TaxID=187491 RepID=UPI0025B506EA|nr:hypothetical protein [Corynebacterium glaucum]WJZ06817.1 ABC-2 family transporter protein [Corynebacterium glaucum]